MTYEDISGPVAYKDISGPVTIENVIFWHPSYRSSKQRNERRTKSKRNWMRRILQAELLWVSDDQTGKLQPNRWECLFNSSSDLRCRVFQWIVVNPFHGFWRPLTVLILLWGDYFKKRFQGAQDEIRKLNQAHGISCRCDHVWVISAAVIVQENSHLTATNEKLKLDCTSLLTSNHSNCLGETVYYIIHILCGWGKGGWKVQAKKTWLLEPQNVEYKVKNNGWNLENHVDTLLKPYPNKHGYVHTSCASWGTSCIKSWQVGASEVSSVARRPWSKRTDNIHRITSEGQKLHKPFFPWTIGTLVECRVFVYKHIYICIYIVCDNDEFLR